MGRAGIGRFLFMEFLVRDSMLSSEHAICYRRSVCLSVHPSHG